MRLPPSVLLVTALALALRLFDLNSQLWHDEIKTLVESIRFPLLSIITSYSENQHTLYSILAKGVVEVWGEDAWALRLWAVILGTLSVPMLYILGRTMTSHREALAAATLLAVSYHHIWFSQDARGYTGLLFATLVTTWCFIVGLERREARLWLLYGVAGAFGAAMHLTMVFVIASHALVLGLVALRRRRQVAAATLRQLLAGILLAGVLTAAFYVPALPQMVPFFLRERLPSIAQDTDYLVMDTLRGLRFGFGAAGLVIGTVLAALGCWRYLRQSIVLFLLLVLPGLLTLTVMLVLDNELYPRWFFYATGFALLILARGAAAAGELLARLAPPAPRAAASRWIYVGLIAAMVAATAASLPSLYGMPRQDFLGALRFLESARAPEDTVVAYGAAGTVYLEYYRAPWVKYRNLNDLEATLARPGRTWFVYTWPAGLRFARPELARLLDRRFKMARSFPGTVGGAPVDVLVEDTGS